MTADITRRVGSETRCEELNGLADSQLFVQYDGLYARNAPGGLTRLAVFGGLQVPIGASRFSREALQYTGGLVFEKAVKLKYVFTADLEYTLATENHQGRGAGNLTRFDMAPAYFIIPRHDLPSGAGWLRKAFHLVFRNGAYAIVEFNGASQARAHERSTRVPNTGATTLFISPGIQYFVSRSFMIEFSAPIPVLRALNGDQPRPDSTFLLGFRWLY